MLSEKNKVCLFCVKGKKEKISTYICSGYIIGNSGYLWGRNCAAESGVRITKSKNEIKCKISWASGLWEKEKALDPRTGLEGVTVNWLLHSTSFYPASFPH